MDYGKLTDHNGKTVDFRNVILIMTTNAGASELAQTAIGFGSEVRSGDDQEAINRMFTPEFPQPAGQHHLLLAAGAGDDPSRPSTNSSCSSKCSWPIAVSPIELDDEARAWLAKKGYDRLYGARPLGRVIQGKRQEAVGRGAAVRSPR